jgi:FkbM family methyltransferase
LIDPRPSKSRQGTFHPVWTYWGRTVLAGLGYFGIPSPVGEPEQRLLRRLDLLGTTAIDVGANLGIYTLLLARLVGPAGRVVAYEPLGRSARQIDLLRRVVGAQNVTVRPVSVGSRFADAVELHAPLTRRGRLRDAYLSTSAAGGVLVGHAPMTSIDYEVSNFQLRDISVIKCDVEGGELDVLRGAADTLKQFQPLILTELEERWTTRFGYHPSDLIEFAQECASYREYVLVNRVLRPVLRREQYSHLHNRVLIPPRWEITLRRIRAMA